jgi:hypothetical protein
MMEQNEHLLVHGKPVCALGRQVCIPDKRVCKPVLDNTVFELDMTVCIPACTLACIFFFFFFFLTGRNS